VTRFKTATDFRKSLEERLRKTARETGQDLQRIRRKVAFDRLLARIFHEDNDAQFLLKGGYAMELRFERARATKDIDLTYLERFLTVPESEVTEEIHQEIHVASQVPMDDFFVFRIENAQLDLENAPYGGARYPVSSFIDGRIFVRFLLDVGLDIMVNKVEKVRGNNWLEFCDVPSPVVSVITEEQQLAEKVHAYTLPRDGRMNSRVKDLIDLLLLLENSTLDSIACNEALQTVFKVRNTHPLPERLLFPPESWDNNFKKMAVECLLDPDMSNGFEKVNVFFQKLLGFKY